MFDTEDRKVLICAWKALGKLLSTLPCDVRDLMTEEEYEAYALADELIAQEEVELEDE